MRLLLALLTLIAFSFPAEAKQHRHSHRHHHTHQHPRDKNQKNKHKVVHESSPGSTTGMASYYHEGQRVACGGKRFDPNAMTAAHPSLPCGAVVTVTNQRNGKSVTVTINDRGPAPWTHRVIDLSRGAGAAIDMLRAGVVPVSVEVQR